MAYSLIELSLQPITIPSLFIKLCKTQEKLRKDTSRERYAIGATLQTGEMLRFRDAPSLAALLWMSSDYTGDENGAEKFKEIKKNYKSKQKKDTNTMDDRNWAPTTSFRCEFMRSVP